ncbi:hypothetical protein BH23ACT10_BH23ACT10_05510 [soil metagenome]
MTGRDVCSGAAAVWPWLVAEIERRLDEGGVDPVTATVQACLGGPPALRSAADDAVRTAGDADAVALLAALRDRVNSADGDRVFATIAAVHVSAAPTDAPLAGLRARMSTASAHGAERAAVASGVTVARWLVLVPVVPVAAGDLAGTAGWCAAAAAVGLWWWTGQWVRPRRDVRVFGAGSIGVGP